MHDEETGRRWAAEAVEQESLAALEERALFDLLEEGLRVELLIGNMRRFDGERESLRERLRDVARESLRLEEERANWLSSLEARTRGLLQQQERLAAQIARYESERAADRRRRSRDRLWLEALLLERGRLSLERRRLEEQQASLHVT